MNISPGLMIDACHERKVLVIDDDDAFRSLLAEALEREGYRVRVAADGNAAVAVARREAFHLVIADMIMPGKDGIETILELRHHAPGVRVIAISGGGSGQGGDYLPLALTLGAVRTLRKPFSREALLQAVAEALAPPSAPARDADVVLPR